MFVRRFARTTLPAHAASLCVRPLPAPLVFVEPAAAKFGSYPKSVW